jgi:hypothetical protein
VEWQGLHRILHIQHQSSIERGSALLLSNKLHIKQFYSYVCIKLHTKCRVVYLHLHSGWLNPILASFTKTLKYQTLSITCWHIYSTPRNYIFWDRYIISPDVINIPQLNFKNKYFLEKNLKILTFPNSWRFVIKPIGSHFN